MSKSYQPPFIKTSDQPGVGTHVFVVGESSRAFSGPEWIGTVATPDADASSGERYVVVAPDRAAGDCATFDQAVDRMLVANGHRPPTVDPVEADLIEYGIDSNVFKDWQQIHSDFKLQDADGTRRVMALSGNRGSVLTPWRGPEAASNATDPGAPSRGRSRPRTAAEQLPEGYQSPAPGGPSVGEPGWGR
ncbi:hypothetical protein [Nesterenkonia alkaliphila]|uniref:Uncharacterized protein n=1 Tax=Nesterenkonia alkaliphila TaxID=1463631 RepID=A0A7K1UGW4_9MICC|nr:hypothetical protein [Nesterenkonia alkaliphila]MVT25715.1 hypothetical protein [Nesterenkonia alkaliphila]GFZ85296.1 hypothetical protein GCM10011359_13020 [Nesterenkonia alkaliphila]